MNVDPYLIVRAGSVYIAAAASVVSWAWRRPSRRMVAGAVLATAWNLPALLALHLAAARFGWWQFDAHGGLLLGMPVDLYLAWACAWGFIAALAFPTLPLALVVAWAWAVDVVLMPAAAPVVVLGSGWMVGEIVGLSTALVPAQLLARWTTRDECVAGRAILQVLAFGGLILFVVPAAVIQASGGSWFNPLTYSVWQICLFVQVIALPALLGLTGVQEFVERGGGTPVPFDPPQRLVTSGIYAYLRNPMQLAGVLVLFLTGIALRNAWLSAAGVMAHLYSAGLAGWDEDQDLQRRFGDDWQRYRAHVRRWVPRWRPRYIASARPALLYVAVGCGMCRETGHWFARRGPTGLLIVAAESHPMRALTRITYDPSDGTPAVVGIEAIARALEHIHFGWALLGFAMRLPLVRPLIQLLADASGTEPRAITRNKKEGLSPFFDHG